MKNIEAEGSKRNNDNDKNNLYLRYLTYIELTIGFVIRQICTCLVAIKTFENYCSVN